MTGPTLLHGRGSAPEQALHVFAKLTQSAQLTVERLVGQRRRTQVAIVPVACDRRVY